MSNVHYDKVKEMLKEVEAKLREVTEYADQHGVEFYWDGPSYGMGGSYHPRSSWADSGCSDGDWSDSGCSIGVEEGSWRASSHSF